MQHSEKLHKRVEIIFVKGLFRKNDQWLAGIRKNTDLMLYKSLFD